MQPYPAAYPPGQVAPGQPVPQQLPPGTDVEAQQQQQQQAVEDDADCICCGIPCTIL